MKAKACLGLNVWRKTTDAGEVMVAWVGNAAGVEDMASWKDIVGSPYPSASASSRVAIAEEVSDTVGDMGMDSFGIPEDGGSKAAA